MSTPSNARDELHVESDRIDVRDEPLKVTHIDRAMSTSSMSHDKLNAESDRIDVRDEPLKVTASNSR